MRSSLIFSVEEALQKIVPTQKLQKTAKLPIMHLIALIQMLQPDVR